MDDNPSHLELATVYTSTWIEHRVEELARQIDDAYKYTFPPVIGIVVMNAALYFAADLTMALRVPVDVHAYDPRQLIRPPADEIKNRNVLIIDTICETGKTINEILTWCQDNGAASVCQAVLLDRHAPGTHPNHFIGERVDPGLFYVGYGLDKEGMYRNLNHIDVLSQPWSEQGYTRANAVQGSASS